MGKRAEKNTKRLGRDIDKATVGSAKVMTGVDSIERGAKAVKKKIDEPLRIAEQAAQAQADSQAVQIEKQEGKEKLRLAEANDAVARKRKRTRKGGRSLLIATSPTGTENLGG